MSIRFIFYDTETSGINPLADRIIEIAAYDPVNNKSFVSLINPGIIIPPEMTAISGITNEMVKDAPDFKEAIKGFYSMCLGNVILVAHNNDSFDRPFLEAEHKRSGLSMPQWFFVDSLKWARKYRKDLPKHSLQYLREYFKIEKNEAHRALDDTITLSKVFYKMIDDLRPEEVLELMHRPFIMHKMPFGKYQGVNLKEVPKHYLEWLKKEGFFEKPGNQDLKASFEHAGLLEKGAS